MSARNALTAPRVSPSSPVSVERTAPAAGAVAGRRSRGSLSQRARRLLPATVSIAVVLAIWELLTGTQVISSRYFPSMTDTFDVLGQQLVSGGFWTVVSSTLQGWALGLGIAAAGGVSLGIVTGSSRLLYRATRGLVEFLRPIPSVALIPLAVLVYGSGLASKVFLVTFASFWPVLLQTIYGVQDVDPVAMDTARSFGLTHPQRLVRVTLPGAVPYIATGLRISAAVALILAVTAELVIGSPGLGRAISLARSGDAVELMYALIVATGLLGWMLNGLFVSVERRVLHWHPSQRKEASR